MDITYSTLSDLEEIRQLQKVFQNAFEGSDSKKHLALVQKENHVDSDVCIIGAISDSRVIGGLVAYELRLLNGTKEMYLYDIAVLPEFQKKGIGTKLIDLLKEEGRRRGATTIFVEAEADDDTAVAFYRSLGEEELEVRHFNISI